MAKSAQASSNHPVAGAAETHSRGTPLVPGPGTRPRSSARAPPTPRSESRPSRGSLGRTAWQIRRPTLPVVWSQRCVGGSSKVGGGRPPEQTLRAGNPHGLRGRRLQCRATGPYAPLRSARLAFGAKEHISLHAPPPLGAVLRGRRTVIGELLRRLTDVESPTSHSMWSEGQGSTNRWMNVTRRLRPRSSHDRW